MGDFEIKLASDKLHNEFEEKRIVHVHHFLQKQHLQRMQHEAESNISLMTSSYIPTHKKGKCLSYENIRKVAPKCLEFYQSPIVADFVSKIVGEKVYQTPEMDQSSLSVLCYNTEGDHINWHYDHDFYYGRHFTVLLSLINEKKSPELYPLAYGLSSCEFIYKENGKETVASTLANTLLIFEGDKVLHKATPIKENELRVILSMTYCTDPRISLLKEAARRVKDTAFHGISALWK